VLNRDKLEKRIREIKAALAGYFRELEGNDDRESSVNAVKAEGLKAKMQ
jgi:hypothetical protein